MLNDTKEIIKFIVENCDEGKFESILNSLEDMQEKEELRIRIAKFKPKKITLKVMEKSCHKCKSFNDMDICGLNCPVDDCDGCDGCPIEDDEEKMGIYCPSVDGLNTCGRWEAKDVN